MGVKCKELRGQAHVSRFTGSTGPGRYVRFSWGCGTCICKCSGRTAWAWPFSLRSASSAIYPSVVMAWGFLGQLFSEMFEAVTESCEHTSEQLNEGDPFYDRA